MAAEDPFGEGVPRTATLAQVYREHFDFVWRSLLRLGFSPAEAEDVAQDVFLVVHRRLGDFDRSRSIRAWLYGITRRVAKDRRRGQGREERRLRLLPSPAPGPDPERAAARAEAAALVQLFLDGLDSDLRSIFVLAELEGFGGTEIAEAMNLNRNTVYTRLRALKRDFSRFIERQAGDREQPR